MRLAARRVLLDQGPPRPATLTLDGPLIASVTEGMAPDAADLGDLLLAPGLIDVHGDAFERQLMPRPGVMVDPAVAMLDTDRQLAASGITTAFHAITWSWEPGLRSVATGMAVIDALDHARAAEALLADHRVHIRREAFNLDGQDALLALIQAGRIELLSFNDHTPGMAANAGCFPGNHATALRATTGRDEFDALARQVHGRAAEVPAATASVAAACLAAAVPMLSHDDASPAERDRFRALGARICEFPMDRATAEHARSHGDPIVMGAPNAVRGRSHLGWLSASEAVAAGLCTALVSDYWYPALLQVPFRLALRGVLPLEAAWPLVSRNAAWIAGLVDRGALVAGLRADLIAVDDRLGLPPRVVATWAGSRRVWGG